MWDNIFVESVQDYLFVQIILSVLGGFILVCGILGVLQCFRSIDVLGLVIVLPLTLCLILLGGFCLGAVVMPKIKSGIKSVRHSSAQDEMMESCFEAAPALETTLQNLQAEIDKWEESKNKFIRMRDASQTAGGRSLAENKLTRIEQVIKGLKGSHHKVLEQVEMIAIESAGQFTELDKKALEDLGRKVESSVRDAQELREGLAGD